MTSQIPDVGRSESGFFHWGCGSLSDASTCPLTVNFRGAGSSDPDDDITSGSLDFDDGVRERELECSSADGRRARVFACPRRMRAVVNSINKVCVITLTVADSAGHSHSDAMVMVFVDQTPD